MSKATKTPKHNFLKMAYEEIWVPIFGRLLTLFVSRIEGKPLMDKPTYDLRDKEK